ncbi:MAG: hypothetical protein WCO60_09730 [Verrucomicrobiota bacterium]
MYNLFRTPITKPILILAGALTLPNLGVAESSGSSSYQDRVKAVTEVPGFVALWDFVKRESDGNHRFTAHVSPADSHDYALDAGNYVKDFWGEGRDASYADFPLLGRGPFGQAIQMRKEEEATFRPLLFVPRERLHDSAIDLKGAGKSVTLVVWAIRESGNHALAGIWHEGTDLKQDTTKSIQKVERGQRQYGLFAGLNKEGSACAHVSENGASSFAYKYAMHKTNTLEISQKFPADSPAEVLDKSWECFAMTFDNERDELAGWLNGTASVRWQDNVKKSLPPVYNAWLQGELHRTGATNPAKDESYPHDQFYNPPEGTPVSVKVLSETADERVELHEFQYTKIKLTLSKDAAGKFAVKERDLSEISLNPWWFPYDMYSPADAKTGGPFTIGRVIHSSKSVGFTGWIGGVAIFNRALTEAEMKCLSELGRQAPIATPTSK